jgi:endonuclease/exonuclease/phosphatase family metal-dependent hydrolase
MKRLLQWLAGGCTFFIVGFFVYVWMTTEQYADLEPAEVHCSTDAPILNSETPLKVLSWNIQFLAGKNYVFFYDAIDGSGKDEAPSREDQAITLKEVTRVIREENPDVVLLQEVDVDAKRTGYNDQIKLLLEALAPLFPCSVSTYYWRAGFLPHPNIMGSIGMKLATFSKYKIEKAQRHALGDFPANLIVRQFRPKRAILDSFLPTNKGEFFRVLNTHLEAYSQGSNLMQYQVQLTSKLLNHLESSKLLWFIGGDFNLLAPGRSYQDLSPTQRKLYQEHSELKVLTDQFRMIPSLLDINGELHPMWYTHFPNDPEVKGPDRTIDYIFYGTRLNPKSYRVRSHDTLKISDHLPLVADLFLRHLDRNTP